MLSFDIYFLVCDDKTVSCVIILQIDDMYQVSDFFDDSPFDSSGGWDEVNVDHIVQRGVEQPHDYITS